MFTPIKDGNNNKYLTMLGDDGCTTGGWTNCHKIFWHMPKIIRVDSVVGYSMTTSNNWCIRLVYSMHYVSENPTATKEDESICMSHCGW